jgi:hypothetical protein
MSIPGIVCIAKKEHDYIEEFVKYHLALGFEYIYIYDNEDIPTYEKLLEHYKPNVKVIHIPGNNYSAPVQYIILQDFIVNHKHTVTHFAHIDIDEFIVLKKHKNIKEFIEEYITGDCVGIGMNWRFFGSSGHTEKTDVPVTIRFTKCQTGGNMHIKTLVRSDAILHFKTVHDVSVGFGHIKSTHGEIVNGPWNHSIDLSIIQLNHYKCKTLPEYKYIRTRNRADVKGPTGENPEADFHAYNANDEEDLFASNFYREVLLRKTKN